jgi:hypothetical protein
LTTSFSKAWEGGREGGKDKKEDETQHMIDIERKIEKTAVKKQGQ